MSPKKSIDEADDLGLGQLLRHAWRYCPHCATSRPRPQRAASRLEFEDDDAADLTPDAVTRRAPVEERMPDPEPEPVAPIGRRAAARAQARTAAAPDDDAPVRTTRRRPSTQTNNEGPAAR